MIFALIGEDVFLLRRGLEKLLGERIPAAARDFNLETLEGESVVARDLMERAGTLPVLSPRRVILIREADKIRKGETDRLEPLLSSVPETTDLILVAEKPDSRTTFWKTVRTLAKVQEFLPLHPEKVPAWILEEASRAGLKISSEAARWLAEAVGNDLGVLFATLQKLSLMKKGGGVVTVEDAEAAVIPFSWKSVFDLTNAVGERDLPLALKLFRRMSAAGESPVGLLALLGRHFRILTKVCEGETTGIPYLRDYQAQGAGFKTEDLGRCRETIFQADWALKSSPIPDDLVFERLLMDLCRSAN